MPKHYYFALTYSCLSIKKFYPQLELVTDDLGADLLINKLNLPYSNVSFLPDYIQNLPTGLSAFPKIYSEFIAIIHDTVSQPCHECLLNKNF